jgi:2,3-bisphosphoglycerate-independent phosphoglycerate mutase
MVDPVSGHPHTYHTTNPVPLLLISENDKARLQPSGSLRDIAPTMLSALGERIPGEMTGKDLRIGS